MWLKKKRKNVECNLEPTFSDLKIAFEILWTAGKDPKANQQEVQTGKDRVVSQLNKKLKMKGDNENGSK